MTREEVISKWIYPAISTMWTAKTCNEILEALEQEPCEDCISRETARRIVDSGRTRQQMIDMILATPSVKPQEPVLDNIKAEIREFVVVSIADVDVISKNDVLDIIDKHIEG